MQKRGGMTPNRRQLNHDALTFKMAEVASDFTAHDLKPSGVSNLVSFRRFSFS
jgi:hypothetical protein